MAPFLRRVIPLTSAGSAISRNLRKYTTVVSVPKGEGDISAAFVSLSGAQAEPLPSRFADLKRRLVRGYETQLTASWDRLLRELQHEIQNLKIHGSNVIPEIHFEDIDTHPASFEQAVHKRGVAVIRGVVLETEARKYKDEVERYVKDNPSTKAFPPHDPQVYELYWSPSQVRARAHPNLIASQRFLMNLWHSKDPNAAISSSHPIAYADRVRIRQPGDASFALGPHVDGGSLERWEEGGYGLGSVYDKIWQGEWEQYDPWESSCRLPVISDLYNGSGTCSAFRMFQGWLSMSRTGPNEGTLLVNPMLQLSTAYYLLRPFFTPRSLPAVTPSISEPYTPEFLDSSNWQLESETTSLMQGASPGHGQELNSILHPHLDLATSMVSIPKINPGDYVAWHCDTIHAVDPRHLGASDSSVLYTPTCPLTMLNARYIKQQRDAFLRGFPAPDFPGGKGEDKHRGRPTEKSLREYACRDGLRAMGLEAWDNWELGLSENKMKLLKEANEALGL